MISPARLPIPKFLYTFRQPQASNNYEWSCLYPESKAHTWGNFHWPTGLSKNDFKTNWPPNNNYHGNNKSSVDLKIKWQIRMQKIRWWSTPALPGERTRWKLCHSAAVCKYTNGRLDDIFWQFAKYLERNRGSVGMDKFQQKKEHIEKDEKKRRMGAIVVVKVVLFLDVVDCLVKECLNEWTLRIILHNQ